MRARRSLWFIVGLLWLAWGSAASFAAPESRVALVIGNSRYLNTPTLPNPGNDATDVAQALAEIGFKVTLSVDATKRNFDEALAQFSRQARDADAALFFYAGHGMQYQGRNYVMPIDAELQDEVSLRYEMVSVDDVKASLQVSRGVKILVLDSCRDNPLAEKLVRSIKATTRDLPKVQGLARTERTSGMIIVYATQADDVAHDGTERNSPFSQAFIKELRVPGLEVGALFRRVEDDVFTATEGRQSPELSISMVPEYYLNQAETDQMAWARARSANDAAALRDFIRRYPGSFYIPDATTRLLLIDPADSKAPTIDVAPADAGAGGPPLPTVPVAPPVPAPSPAPGRVVTLTDPKIAALTPSANKPAFGQSSVVSLIRSELRRLGCFAGGDFDWDSPPMKQGIAKYARYANLASATVEPDNSVVEEMKKRPAGLCPPDCAPREVALGGRCVAKTCPRGKMLTNAGACILKPVAATREPRVEPTAPAVAPKKSAGGRCFVFNGNEYCE